MVKFKLMSCSRIMMVVIGVIINQALRVSLMMVMRTKVMKLMVLLNLVVMVLPMVIEVINGDCDTLKVLMSVKIYLIII